MQLRIIAALLSFAGLVYGAATFDGLLRVLMVAGAVAAGVRLAYEVRDERRERRGG